MKTVAVSGTPGLSGLLFLLFLGLKLTDNIDWSWWWITSPLWIPLALCLPLLVGFGLFVLWKVTR